MNQILRRIFLSRVALHVYFWVFIFFSFNVLYLFPTFRAEGIIKNLLYFPADILFTYFFLYVLNKLITKQKKFLLFIIIFTFSIVGYTFITFTIDQTIVPHILGKSVYKSYNIHTFVHSAWVIVMIALAAGYIKIIRLWNRVDEDRIRAELEKSNAYNQLLRSKVNPHFLFNTLNNITSLIDLDNEKAKESIIGLGGLMAYMVYEAEDEHVLLEKELEYIQNFINLQSLRISQEDFIHFKIEGDPGNLKIASMLLIPLVENAFKFCDQNSKEGINISIQIRNKQLILDINNPVDKQTNNKDRPGGFGLQNVKKRLEMYYHERHQLKLKESSRRYDVELYVEL